MTDPEAFSVSGVLADPDRSGTTSADRKAPARAVVRRSSPLVGWDGAEGRAGDRVRRMWQLRSDPMWWWIDGVRQHGEIVEKRLLGVRVFTVYRARHAEHVLVTNQDNYIKGPMQELVALASGQGLVSSNGDLWRRQRRLIQPMFAKRHVQTFAEHMIGAGARLLEEWDTTLVDGADVDVGREMLSYTLDVVGRALFGADLTGNARDTISRAMTEVLTELQAAGDSPLTWAAYSLPGMTMERALSLTRPVRRHRFLEQIRQLDAIVAAMVDRHRTGAQRGADDLLTLLLDARDEDTGAPMSDRQVRDEVVTFIAAGHETTATALSWLWVCLSRYPEARARVYAEVDELLQGRPPTFEDVDRLRYTRAAIQEALRFYPPVWLAARRAVHDDAIDGVPVPAGSNIAILIYLTHRDPDVWPNPEAFDPGRFLREQSGKLPRCAHIPFTAGRRICVGNTFALTEAVILAAMIAQCYVLDLEPTERVRPEPHITLRPRRLVMRAYRRSRYPPELAS
jgi:cytochrome P450